MLVQKTAAPGFGKLPYIRLEGNPVLKRDDHIEDRISDRLFGAPAQQLFRIRVPRDNDSIRVKQYGSILCCLEDTIQYFLRRSRITNYMGICHGVKRSYPLYRPGAARMASRRSYIMNAENGLVVC
jgi:hypothetical protein